jgi:hypothetical protein
LGKKLLVPKFEEFMMYIIWKTHSEDQKNEKYEIMKEEDFE